MALVSLFVISVFQSYKLSKSWKLLPKAHQLQTSEGNIDIIIFQAKPGAAALKIYVCFIAYPKKTRLRILYLQSL